MVLALIISVLFVAQLMDINVMGQLATTIVPVLLVTASIMCVQHVHK